MTEIVVVVIGRNEGERLAACLRSIVATGCPIIYVDSGSTDRSLSIAATLGAVVVQLDPAVPFTAARARNAGLKRLQVMRPLPEYVQFIDGDCILSQDWLLTARDFLNSRSDVAIVCGRRRERHPEASVYNRMCDLEWDTPIGKTQECGGDSLARVDALSSVYGFDETLIAGEEPELCVRLREKGWTIWRLDAEMTLHDANITRLHQWWRRSARAGYAFAEVARRHRRSSVGIWKRSVVRAMFWGAVFPLLTVLCALVHPAGLLLAAVYPIQIARIAFHRNPRKSASWVYASFVMLGKLAEAQGIARFYVMSWRGQRSRILEYK